MQKLKTTLLSSWQNTSHINVLLKCATNPRADQGGIEEVPCQNCLVMSRGTKGCKMAILRPYLPQYAAVFGVFLFQLPSPARSIFSLRSQGGSSRFHDTARYSCFHCQGLRFLLPTEAIPIHPAPQTQTKTLQLPCHEAPQRSSFMHRRMNALVLPSLLVQCPSPIVLQLKNALFGTDFSQCLHEHLRSPRSPWIRLHLQPIPIYAQLQATYLQHVLRHGAAHMRTSIEVLLGREVVQVSRWTQMLTPKLINILWREKHQSAKSSLPQNSWQHVSFSLWSKAGTRGWESAVGKVACHSAKAQMSKARWEKTALQKQSQRTLKRESEMKL